MSGEHELHRNHPNFMGPFVCSGKERAYVDMDGTTVDYYGPQAASGLCHADFNSSPHAFRDLPLIPGAREAIAELEELGYDVFFCSRPPANCPQAYADKAESIQLHFPPHLWNRLILTPDKGCLGKPGDILIDDNPTWTNGHNFGGTVFLFKGDWAETMRKVRHEVTWKRQRDEDKRAASAKVEAHELRRVVGRGRG